MQVPTHNKSNKKFLSLAVFNVPMSILMLPSKCPLNLSGWRETSIRFHPRDVHTLPCRALCFVFNIVNGRITPPICMYVCVCRSSGAFIKLNYANRFGCSHILTEKIPSDHTKESADTAKRIKLRNQSGCFVGDKNNISRMLVYNSFCLQPLLSN